MTSIVRFLRLTDDFEQVEIARVTLDGKKLRTSGNQGLIDTLFEDVDRSSLTAVRKVMRNAPVRFDGSYLRATYEEGSDGNG